MAGISNTWIGNLFSRIKPGTSYRVFPWRSWEKICLILETISGIGCKINRTENGQGWTIEVDGSQSTELDTDVDATPPGQSLNRYLADEDATSGPVQLRQFHDMTDVLAVQDASSTGNNPTAADVQILVRRSVQTGESTRPKLEYVEGDGLYWLQGGNGSTNFATEIKIGQNNSFITISAS